MTGSAALLSADAASIAAILTTINLYVSGRTEHHRWACDVLVDVFVAFLNAGFDKWRSMQPARRITSITRQPG